MNPIPRNLWSIVYGLTDSGPWPPESDEAVAKFFNFANAQHLLPLLMADGALPPQLLAMKPKYRLVAALHRMRSDRSLAAAVELTRVLGSENFLFYKGSDYRHRLYEKPEHRVMNDIDAYVPWNEIRSALVRLEALGYAQVFAGSTASHAPGYHEKKIIVHGVLVELHYSFGQRIRAGIDYPAMWQRRERFALEGIEGCRFSPADAILCHAFNLGKDEFTPELNRYLDFYLLLKRHQDRLPACVELAKAWGMERTLFGALHITTSLFGELRTAVVQASMEQLLDRRTRQFLIDRVLPNIATERSGNVMGRRVQIWRKFMLMDKWWRRAAFVWYHLYSTGAGALARLRMRRSKDDGVPSGLQPK